MYFVRTNESVICPISFRRFLDSEYCNSSIIGRIAGLYIIGSIIGRIAGLYGFLFEKNHYKHSDNNDHQQHLQSFLEIECINDSLSSFERLSYFREAE